MVGFGDMMYTQASSVLLEIGSVLESLYLDRKTNKQNYTASLVLLFGIIQKSTCLSIFGQTMLKNLNLSIYMLTNIFLGHLLYAQLRLNGNSVTLYGFWLWLIILNYVSFSLSEVLFTVMWLYSFYVVKPMINYFSIPAVECRCLWWYNLSLRYNKTEIDSHKKLWNLSQGERNLKMKTNQSKCSST